MNLNTKQQSSIWRLPFRLAGRGQLRNAQWLQPPEVFRFFLERERALADRHGFQFSLLVCEVGQRDANEPQLMHFARAVSTRIRCSDVAGWLDRRHVGILLSYTPPSGARKLARDLRELTPPGPWLPEFVVYSHPSEWRQHEDDEDDEDTSQRPFSDIFPEHQPTPKLVESPADAVGSAGSRSFSTVSEWPDAARPLERLLVSSTPAWKRATDVLGSLIGLAMLAPLFLFVILTIRATSRGPAFFRQQRIGYLGEPFTMWKFRTMRTGSDTRNHQQHVANLVGTDDALQKLDTNSQLVPLGKWLRCLCIDELPQLINVFRGNMSLVGPRPDVVPIEQYHAWHRRRFDVVPGMTGLWQVSGKNRTTFKQMIRFDIAYAQHRCFGLDLRILLKTLPTIVKELFED